jgi:hypothetical protein
MTFGPESTAQMKPSKVETSIAFSSSSSESRNPLIRHGRHGSSQKP